MLPSVEKWTSSSEASSTTEFFFSTETKQEHVGDNWFGRKVPRCPSARHNKVTPHYVARARHAVRVHVHHVACARMDMCMHGARTAKRTAPAHAPLHVARTRVCVQRRQAVVALPVRCNGLGGLLERKGRQLKVCRKGR